MTREEVISKLGGEYMEHWEAVNYLRSHNDEQRKRIVELEAMSSQQAQEIAALRDCYQKEVLKAEYQCARSYGSPEGAIMIPEIPKWILQRDGLTARQWKIRKRNELKTVVKAMNKLLLGCAYTPTVDGAYIGRIDADLSRLRKAWSQKEWGK